MLITLLLYFRFPPEKYPVLAFTGAPSSFPVTSDYWPLQKYLRWSTKIENLANAFIKETLLTGPYLGIHLRNDIDFVSMIRSSSGCFY